MLKKIRLALALFFGIAITLLFLDFTGTVQQYFSWMAKIQFLPAVLALNVGAIIFVVALTIIFGRIYCSIICPMGIMQDFFNWLGSKRKKNRFSFKAEKKKTRYIFFGLFVIAAIIGVHVTAAFVSFFAPYSSFGRIATYLIAPVYQGINNLLALAAEHFDSYMFYEKEIWVKFGIAFGVAAFSFIAIAIISFFKGRAYCNTICPVGTALSFFARFSLFRPVIDKSKCIKCKRCERNCKSSCIDVSTGSIDYSRCVSCMNCTGICSKKAIKYKFFYDTAKGSDTAETKQNKTNENPDESRRQFLGFATILAAGTLAKVHAQDEGEGGLAPIEEKKNFPRGEKIVPPGSRGYDSFARSCTGCGLCIANCPNDVLRPGLLKPEMGYEKGYCRPECTRCSEVCPAGAIRKISKADKSSIQIGHAVWEEKNCIVNQDEVECGNCARHCPTGAIQMVPKNPNDPSSLKIPVVNTERCIGCGACENLCPSRPYSAIHVEGHQVHKVL